jgi:hypothetical protein
MIGSKKNYSKSKIVDQNLTIGRRDSSLVRGGGCIATLPGVGEVGTIATVGEGATAHAE